MVAVMLPKEELNWHSGKLERKRERETLEQQ